MVLGKRTFNEAQQEQGGPGVNNLPVIVKLLCPVDRSGPVIGRGGEVIKSIRSETGAAVKLEDVVPGQSERAITISSPDRPGQPTCGAQDALHQLAARIVGQDTPTGLVLPDKVDISIIVDRAFVGSIVGKGGANIRQISTQCGAHLQTLASSPAALVAPEEQVVKASGSFESVKQGLNLAINKIREGLARGVVPAALKSASNGMGGMGGGGVGPGMQPQAKRAAAGPGPGPGASGQAGAAGPGMLQVETMYRVVVPDSRVGTLIGSHGENLKRMREMARADIHVEGKVSGTDMRLAVCKSVEGVGAQMCGAAEALMLVVQHLLGDKAQDDVSGGDQSRVIRIVTAAKQLGAVIGIKGATIKQLSADTGARLAADREKLPSGLVNPTDEALLIQGSVPSIISAVRAVTILLRGIQIKQQAEAKGLPAPPTLAGMGLGGPAHGGGFQGMGMGGMQGGMMPGVGGGMSADQMASMSNIAGRSMGPGMMGPGMVQGGMMAGVGGLQGMMGQQQGMGMGMQGGHGQMHAQQQFNPQQQQQGMMGGRGGPMQGMQGQKPGPAPPAGLPPIIPPAMGQSLLSGNTGRAQYGSVGATPQQQYGNMQQYGTGSTAGQVGQYMNPQGYPGQQGMMGSGQQQASGANKPAAPYAVGTAALALPGTLQQGAQHTGYTMPNAASHTGYAASGVNSGMGGWGGAGAGAGGGYNMGSGSAVNPPLPPDTANAYASAASTARPAAYPQQSLGTAAYGGGAAGTATGTGYTAGTYPGYGQQQQQQVYPSTANYGGAAYGMQPTAAGAAGGVGAQQAGQMAYAAQQQQQGMMGGYGAWYAAGMAPQQQQAATAYGYQAAGQSYGQ